MSIVTEIQQAIIKLPEAEQKALARWFAEVRAHAWDAEIEEDIASGRLEHLAEEALGEFGAGRTKPFPPDEEPSNR